MKIVFQHDHILPVGAYGGIERIIFWHMKELARLGHNVVLIGHEKSKVQHLGIELIAMAPEHYQDNGWHRLIPRDSDIIHLFYNHRPPLEIACINTIQGNGVHGEKFDRNTVFVSRKHAQNHGSESFIYNGIDFSEYPIERSQRTQLGWDHFLFLAKGSWSVKNLKGCVWAARKSKRHLHIAGGRSWWPSRYLHSYGMVGGEEKMGIMATCDALLFPVRWHEPFGIAVIEAMAFGMPVICSPYGSLPELVRDNVGAIVRNRQELMQAMRSAPRNFIPSDIRSYAENNFSINKHACEYIELYTRVINDEKLNDEQPEWNLKCKAQDLLPF